MPDQRIIDIYNSLKRSEEGINQRLEELESKENSPNLVIDKFALHHELVIYADKHYDSMRSTLQTTGQERLSGDYYGGKNIQARREEIEDYEIAVKCIEIYAKALEKIIALTPSPIKEGHENKLAWIRHDARLKAKEIALFKISEAEKENAPYEIKEKLYTEELLFLERWFPSQSETDYWINYITPQGPKGDTEYSIKSTMHAYFYRLNWDFNELIALKQKEAVKPDNHKIAVTLLESCMGLEDRAMAALEAQDRWLQGTLKDIKLRKHEANKVAIAQKLSEFHKNVGEEEPDAVAAAGQDNKIDQKAAASAQDDDNPAPLSAGAEAELADLAISVSGAAHEHS